MVWSYDGDPDGDRKDEVRLLIGDTDVIDPLCQDEEISYVLAQFPPADGKPAWLAGAQMCSIIAGRFGRKAQRSVGPLSISADQQFEHYRTLAADLRALYATNGKTATGMSGITAASPILSGGGPTYLGTRDDFATREV